MRLAWRCELYTKDDPSPFTYVEGRSWQAGDLFWFENEVYCVTATIAKFADGIPYPAMRYEYLVGEALASARSTVVKSTDVERVSDEEFKRLDDPNQIV